MNRPQQWVTIIGGGLAMLALIAWLSFAYPWSSVPYFAIDFTVFHSAARALLDGANPYRLSELAAYAPPGSVNEVLRYGYPPLLVEILAPAGLLSLDVAARLWLALNLPIPAASVVMLLHAAQWRPRPVVLAGLIFGATLFLPTVYTLLSGQASLWLLIWASAGVWALSQEAEAWGGLAWALAWAKPHPTLLAPVALLLHYRRALPMFLAVTAASLLLVAPLLPGWIEALHELLQANNAGDEWLYQATATGVVSRLGVAGWAARVVLVGLGVAALVYLREKGIGWKGFAVAYTTLGLLVAPYVGRSDVAVALIPMVLIGSDWQRTPGPAILVAVAWAIPLLSVALYTTTDLDWVLLPLVWGGLAQWTLAGAAGWYVWRILRQMESPDAVSISPDPGLAGKGMERTVK